MRRECHSQEHAQAWAKWDRMLMYRANFTFFNMMVYMLGFTALGITNYQESERFMAREGSVFNQELMDQIFPYLKNIILIMGVSRIFLLLIAFKKLEVAKTFLLYMYVYKVVEAFIPRDYGEMREKFTMQMDLIDFTMLYFDFWSSIALNTVCHFADFFISLKVYNVEYSHGGLAMTLLGALWQFFCFWMIHLVLSWMGHTFVTIELTKRGNEGILDNLSEGVVIVEQDSGIVKFYNKAAERFNSLMDNT